MTINYTRETDMTPGMVTSPVNVSPQCQETDFDKYIKEHRETFDDKIDRELTMIYDNKPDVEVFQDAVYDVETVRAWYQHMELSDAKQLRNAIKCYNTSHGLDILLKLISIDGLDITMEQAVGVLLHDVCKYKNRTSVIEMMMSHYTGREVDEIANHGVNSAILILSTFPEFKCQDMLFVFRHAKKKPYKCDSDKLTQFEKAFFIFDDIVKDIKHYKHEHPQRIHDINKFFYQPKVQLIDYIFMTLKDINHKK